MTQMNTKAPMPRLSADLTGPRSLDHCQACGGGVRENILTIWRECDELDRPEMVFVVLCGPCSEKLIEPHPRLYEQVRRNQPLPGIMELCRDCRHRDGTRCACPLARANGGTGIAIRYPQPHTAFYDGVDKHGRRRGWTGITYAGPATSCSGRETVKETNSDDR